MLFWRETSFQHTTLSHRCIRILLQPSCVRCVNSIRKRASAGTTNGWWMSIPSIGLQSRLSSSCHRVHEKPDITNTLLALNMYSNFEMQYGLDDEYDAGRYCPRWVSFTGGFFCFLRYWLRIRRIRTVCKFQRFLWGCSTWIRQIRSCDGVQSLFEFRNSSSWQRLCRIWNVRELRTKHLSLKYQCPFSEPMKQWKPI